MCKILMLGIFLSIQTSFSQVNVGQVNYMLSFARNAEIEEEALAAFKKTITVFVVPEQEKTKLNEYKEALSSSWFFNQLEVIEESRMEEYIKKGGYSFINLKCWLKDNGGGFAYFYLEYWMPYLTKKGKEREYEIASITLYPDAKSEQKLSTITTSDYKEKVKEGLKTVKFYNLSPAQMKCYLSFMSQKIVNKETHRLNDEVENSFSLKKLATDTLFIPEYVISNPAMSGGKGENLNIKDLAKDYGFKYQVLDEKKLEGKILNSAKPIYVLMYVWVQRGGGSRYFTVFDAHGGVMVYSHIDMKQKPIEVKDFELLGKKIQKALKE
jgi:hypothetical protein